MRGAQSPAEVWGAQTGIIPAYAGSTGRPRWTPRWRRDHPRVCGEHGHMKFSTVFEAGSSPRMRGARCHMPCRCGCRGIIPAYAGSTRIIKFAQLVAEDHPRVCGEHYSTALATSTRWGSSPRMRGAPEQLTVDALVAGIIPAYAGSTGWTRSPLRSAWDHPRVCGEHGRPRAAF